jgi:four helix bundle protein
MAKRSSYKDLVVWRKVHETSLRIIDVLEKFPTGRAFDVVANQILRSSTSVGANIPEGHTSSRGKAFASYLDHALRSAGETDNWIQVIKDSSSLRKRVDLQELQAIEAMNVEVIRMLISSIRKIDASR